MSNCLQYPKHTVTAQKIFLDVGKKLLYNSLDMQTIPPCLVPVMDVRTDSDKVRKVSLSDAINQIGQNKAAKLCEMTA